MGCINLKQIHPSCVSCKASLILSLIKDSPYLYPPLKFLISTLMRFTDLFGLIPVLNLHKDLCLLLFPAIVIILNTRRPMPFYLTKNLLWGKQGANRKNQTKKTWSSPRLSRALSLSFIVDKVSFKNLIMGWYCSFCVNWLRSCLQWIVWTLPATTKHSK